MIGWNDRICSPEYSIENRMKNNPTGLSYNHFSQYAN